MYQSDGRGDKTRTAVKLAKNESAASERDAAKSSQTRVLDVLQLIAASERPLSLPELSIALSIPKPTVFRLCQRLEADGYLEREPGGRHFNVGPSLVRLGLYAIRTGGPKLERHAILQSLVDTVGETCNFTTRAGADVLYLDRVETRWPLRLHLEPGSRVPIHCTSSGKIFLAHMSKAERDAVLGQKKLTPHTPSTITSRKDLEAHLESVVAKDYSVDNEEFLLGLVAVAVPVRDAAGNVVAALACHAPVARMPVAKAIKQLPHIRAAAARLGDTLPVMPAKSS